MTLVKWNPRRSLITDFDRLIGDFFNDDWKISSQRNSTWTPAIDIEEKDEEFVLTADTPGMTKKDVKLNIRDGVLSIKGERKVEKEDESGTYHYRERHLGTFCLTFRLPETVNEEKINATFQNGILTVSLPKFEEVKPKEREIKIS